MNVLIKQFAGGEDMFAKLVTTGYRATPCISACATGPAPVRGNCIDVGKGPLAGFCDLGLLA